LKCSTPFYFNNAYYLYPAGPIAFEVLPVITRAMAESGVVGLGHLTVSRRKRMAMVEHRRTGMALFTLRGADEVRTLQSGSPAGDLNAEMVAIARAIIAQRNHTFDPTTETATRKLCES
jgi:non-homologous end joining protein Ku